MAGLKRHAFGTLMRWRYGAQRMGLDRLARRNVRLQSALRASYRTAYRVLQPPQTITGEIRGLRVSAGADQRDLSLLLLGAREWEDRQARQIESLLDEGMVFVDVGAHIGVYSLLAARRVGSRGRVYAFEPAPSNYRSLLHNIAANQFSNVMAEPLAVSDARGRAAFTLSRRDSASHSLAGGLHPGERVEVETVSLDEYFADHQCPIDVVKLDAEGAELKILAGMRAILSRNPGLVLFTELYPNAMDACGTSPEEYLTELRKTGFELNLFEDEAAEPRSLADRQFAVLVAGLRERGAAANLLCLPENRPRSRFAASVGEAGTVAVHAAMEPSKPLISIAIPTYNRAELLDRTLASILPQVGDDVEIVVYDTGSTDDTCARINELTPRNPAVRFFHTAERRNLDETLLLLLGVARGEYVWFFSSDDEMKPGAIDAVRRRILRSSEVPALVYVNQEIIDEASHLLIASQVESTVDREFRDGRQIFPWLGLNLGFVSASVIRLSTALSVSFAPELIGTRSLNLHLYLCCLLRGGPAVYIHQPLIRARRASGPPPYEYRDVFVSHIVRILKDARRRGFGRAAVYRAMQRIIVGTYLPLVYSWRCDDPAELERTFPVMLRACWMYPAFWLLVVPARLLPCCLARVIRVRLRNLRAWRNERIVAGWTRVRESAARHD